MDDVLDLLESLVLQHLLEKALDLAGAEGRGEAENLESPTLLDELALDTETFLCHFLAAVVANLLIPRLLAPLLQVPFHLQPSYRLQLALLSHQHQSAYVLEGDLPLH